MHDPGGLLVPPSFDPGWAAHVGTDAGAHGRGGMGGQPSGAGVCPHPARGTGTRSQVGSPEAGAKLVEDLLDGGRVTETERRAVLRELTDLAG